MAITLDAQLLEILACPSPDHAPLRAGAPDDPEADALTCTECGRVYPVRDGIPVLLLDEATVPGNSDADSA
ncbi:Trm112 family protein [Amycolatopsis sp. NPDC004625]|uniref:Trm112 family protein n=1 Tax=Amycolatopsis sp. NPDC004625 TaxID=3154670 RepID=UPI0033A2E522